MVGAKLAEKYRVILLDLPGFGSSSVPEKIFNAEEYSNFVNQFVDKINLDKFILIGHSLGGKIAIKNSVNNQKNDSLFLISPSGVNNRTLISNLKIIIVKILKIFVFWLPDTLKTKLIELFASPDYINAGKMQKIFRKIVNEEVVNDAREINIPTYIIWGDKDSEVKVSTSKKLKSLIKDSTLRILWGVGHSPNIEAPEKLVNLLLEYI